MSSCIPVHILIRTSFNSVRRMWGSDISAHLPPCPIPCQLARLLLVPAPALPGPCTRGAPPLGLPNQVDRLHVLAFPSLLPLPPFCFAHAPAALPPLLSLERHSTWPSASPPAHHSSANGPHTTQSASRAPYTQHLQKLPASGWPLLFKWAPTCTCDLEPSPYYSSIMLPFRSTSPLHAAPLRRGALLRGPFRACFTQNIPNPCRIRRPRESRPSCPSAARFSAHRLPLPPAHTRHRGSCLRCIKIYT
ncbi:hypothetical protein DFH09DRAFT_1312109 [Mycena vulgaris]|nr:hypothetical protein DFH09DRAFT_1312109 [Mycena vulgaris]